MTSQSLQLIPDRCRVHVQIQIFSPSPLLAPLPCRYQFYMNGQQFKQIDMVCGFDSVSSGADSKLELSFDDLELWLTFPQTLCSSGPDNSPSTSDAAVDSPFLISVRFQSLEQEQKWISTIKKLCPVPIWILFDFGSGLDKMLLSYEAYIHSLLRDKETRMGDAGGEDKLSTEQLFRWIQELGMHPVSDSNSFKKEIVLTEVFIQTQDLSKEEQDQLARLCAPVPVAATPLTISSSSSPHKPPTQSSPVWYELLIRYQLVSLEGVYMRKECCIRTFVSASDWHRLQSQHRIQDVADHHILIKALEEERFVFYSHTTDEAQRCPPDTVPRLEVSLWHLGKDNELSLWTRLGLTDRMLVGVYLDEDKKEPNDDDANPWLCTANTFDCMAQDPAVFAQGCTVERWNSYLQLHIFFKQDFLPVLEAKETAKCPVAWQMVSTVRLHLISTPPPPPLLAASPSLPPYPKLLGQQQQQTIFSQATPVEIMPFSTPPPPLPLPPPSYGSHPPSSSSSPTQESHRIPFLLLRVFLSNDPKQTRLYFLRDVFHTNQQALDKVLGEPNRDTRQTRLKTLLEEERPWCESLVHPKLQPEVYVGLLDRTGAELQTSPIGQGKQIHEHSVVVYSPDMVLFEWLVSSVFDPYQYVDASYLLDQTNLRPNGNSASGKQQQGGLLQESVFSVECMNQVLEHQWMDRYMQFLQVAGVDYKCDPIPNASVVEQPIFKDWLAFLLFSRSLHLSTEASDLASVLLNRIFEECPNPKHAYFNELQQHLCETLTRWAGDNERRRKSQLLALDFLHECWKKLLLHHQTCLFTFQYQGRKYLTYQPWSPSTLSPPPRL